MQRLFRRAVLTMALFASLGAWGLAADLTGTVRVRRGQRLEALPRVTVVAQAADGSEVLASTKTDGKGQYAFRNLPSNRVALSARRAGFYAHSAGGHEDRQIVLDCSAQQDCAGVDFEMRQGAVITGRVVDELGEPVQLIQVQAVAADEERSPRDRRRSGSMSDDRGIFRIAGMEPGNYALRTEHRRRQAPADELPTASMNVSVGDGEELHGVELILREQPDRAVQTFRVSGRVTGVDLSSAGMRYLSARARSGGNTSVADDGSFQLSLEPGNYRFRYYAPPRPGRIRGVGQAISLGSREISGDISNLVLSPIAATGLEGRVVIESGEAHETMTLWLTSDDAQGNESLTVEAPDYAFQRDDLDPGEYRIRLARQYPGAARLFLKEVNVEGKPSASGTLRLTSGILKDVEIVLSGDFSTIHGRVKAGLDGGELRKGAQYIVGLKGADRVRSVQADQRGQFSFDKVEPGDYKIGAWEDMARGRINQDEAWKEAGSAVREFPVEAGSDIEIDLTAVRQ